MKGVDVVFLKSRQMEILETSIQTQNNELLNNAEVINRYQLPPKKGKHFAILLNLELRFS